MSKQSRKDKINNIDSEEMKILNSTNNDSIPLLTNTSFDKDDGLKANNISSNNKSEECTNDDAQAAVLMTNEDSHKLSLLSNNTDSYNENKNLNSNTYNNSYSSLMCRICHCEETSEEFLISPCFCTGTLKYVHQSCLQQWLKSNGQKCCELCKFDFIMQTKIRSFKNWEKLDMNNIERRKVVCSITFHLIAITCVVSSLYVLIQKTTEEMNSNRSEWSFWTKLVVVAIVFTGSIVFMYVQFKMYIQLCLRWRQYNRVIIIQPINDDIIKSYKKKILALNSKNVNTPTNPNTVIVLNDDFSKNNTTVSPSSVNINLNDINENNNAVGGTINNRQSI